MYHATYAGYRIDGFTRIGKMMIVYSITAVTAVNREKSDFDDDVPGLHSIQIAVVPIDISCHPLHRTTESEISLHLHGTASNQCMEQSLEQHPYDHLSKDTRAGKRKQPVSFPGG